MNPISIASYSVHGLLAEGKIDIFGYLEACRFRYDLRTADIWNGLTPQTDDATLLKIRHEIEARDLILVNYHVDGVHLWEDDAALREKNYRGALHQLQAAAKLGAKTVRFDTGGKIEPLSTMQADYLIEKYGEYCRFAKDHGFRVGPENHWGLSLVADNMERIARGVDHPAYGVLLHLGHWEDSDPNGGDKRIAPFACHTHIDATTTYGNLDEKLRILTETGYSGAYGVEHHSAKNEYAEIAVQIATVRRVLAKIEWERQAGERIAQTNAKAGNPLLTLEQEGLA